MADTKFTGLTPAASMATTDIIPLINDPSGTPTPKKITFDNLQKSITAFGILTTNVEIPLANYVYLGPNGSDGSWRIRVNGTSLVFERRESASWIEKGAVTA